MPEAADDQEQHLSQGRGLSARVKQRQGKPPKPSWRSGHHVPRPKSRLVGGLSPSDAEEKPFPYRPYPPPQPQWRRDPSRPPNLPVVSFLVPILITLVSTTIV